MLVKVYELRIWQAAFVGLRQSAGQFTSRIKYHHRLVRSCVFEDIGQYVMQIICSNAHIGVAYVVGITGFNQITELVGKLYYTNFFHFFLKTNS